MDPDARSITVAPPDLATGLGEAPDRRSLVIGRGEERPWAPRFDGWTPASPGNRRAGARATAGSGRRRWVRRAVAASAVLALSVLALAGLALLPDPSRDGWPARDPAAPSSEAPGPLGTQAGGVAPRAGSAAGQVLTLGDAGDTATAPDAGPAAAGAQEPNAELARLRAAVAAERARLAVLERRRESLIASIEVLRREAVAVRDAASGPGADTLARGDPGRTARAAASMRRDEDAPVTVPTANDADALRIFVNFHAGSRAAELAAAELAATLSEMGFDASGLRPVAAVPSVRLVRYFHSDDAAVAARVAARLGPGWAVQDFRAFTSAPPPRTLEIWLPDR